MWTAVLLAAALLVTGDAKTQQQPAAGGNPLDVVPEKMPFNTAYGTPISLEKAQAAVQAAVVEANKRGWPLNVAGLSIPAAILSHLRAWMAHNLPPLPSPSTRHEFAAKYRRPTKAIEEGVQKGMTILMTLDDVIASRGGIPLIEDGKLIGAIGCSGATGSQDARRCARQVRRPSTDSRGLHVQKPIMTPSDFKHSLARSKPPDGLLPALAALWRVVKDDWNKAHLIVGNGETNGQYQPGARCINGYTASRPLSAVSLSLTTGIFRPSSDRCIVFARVRVSARSGMVKQLWMLGKIISDSSGSDDLTLATF